MSVKFNDDGTKMFTISTGGVKEFFNTAFDITTAANGIHLRLLTVSLVKMVILLVLILIMMVQKCSLLVIILILYMNIRFQ